MKTPITAEHVGKRAKAKTGYAAGIVGKIIPNHSAIGSATYVLKSGMLRTNVHYLEDIELVDEPVQSQLGADAK